MLELMNVMVIIAPIAIFGYITFIHLKLIKIQRDIERSHHNTCDYVYKAVKSINKETPAPTKEKVIEKPTVKGRVWNPSKDMDYVMKGKYVE